MKLESFFDKFDQFADAPDAVARMRKLIIAFSTSGRLVEQNSEDQPASKLLEAAEVQRKALEKSKKIRKQKRLSPVNDEEAPSKLPQNWCWSRLGTTGVIFNGNSINADEKQRKFFGAEGRPYIATKDVGYGFDPLTYENGVRIPESESKFKVAHRYSTLICAEGGSAGRKCGIVDKDICFGNKLFCNEPLAEISAKYILYWYLSPAFTQLFDAVKTGIIGGVSTAKFIDIPIPLPPLAEQKRIVAKMDELMTLCDRLEAQQQERDARHAALARAALARFADAPTPANLQFLFHKSYTITPADLRKSILTLAVQGKLVPQDPNDESAKQLFAKLESERRYFADAHKFRSPASNPVEESSFVFDIPNSWKWCRLSEMFNAITDGDHLPPPKSADGVAFLTIGNITTGKLEFEGSRFVPESYYQGLADFRRPIRGDILYTVVGATFGRPALVETDQPFCVQRHIAILKPPKSIDVGYLMTLLRSPLAYEQATAGTTGTAQPTIPLGGLRNFAAPLPPLAEQHRLVAKVDQLMALVGALETQLTASHATAKNLLEALVAELTATGTSSTEGKA